MDSVRIISLKWCTQFDHLWAELGDNFGTKALHLYSQIFWPKIIHEIWQSVEIKRKIKRQLIGFYGKNINIIKSFNYINQSCIGLSGKVNSLIIAVH